MVNIAHSAKKARASLPKWKMAPAYECPPYKRKRLEAHRFRAIAVTMQAAEQPGWQLQIPSPVHWKISRQRRQVPWRP